MKNSYQDIILKTVRNRIPFKALWELTNRCNLRCSHCYLNFNLSRPELTTEECKLILKKLADAGVLYLTFTGGEILTRPDFFEIAKEARRLAFAIRLLTNGTLINESAADEIKDLQPLSVEMSLYSVMPSIHDKITNVVGSWQKTQDALYMLLKRGIKCIIKSPMMKENIKEFDRLKDLAFKLGAGFQYDLSVIAKEDGSKSPLSHRLSEGEVLEFYLSHQELLKLKTKDKEISDEYPLCSAGVNGFCISPYGDVYPCISIRKSTGNLLEQSFEDIWESSSLVDLASIRRSDLNKCNGCRIFTFCSRCSGVALLEDKDLLGPSSAACAVANARAKANGLYAAGAENGGITEYEKERKETVLSKA